MGKAKSFRQLEQLERFHSGCSERIAACRGEPSAVSALEPGEPVPAAEYRQRRDTYAATGEPLPGPDAA